MILSLRLCIRHHPGREAVDFGYKSIQINSELKPLICHQCKADEFEVALGFEHSIDKEEAKEIVRENKLKIGTEELNTWFIGVGKCKVSGKNIEFISIECA